MLMRRIVNPMRSLREREPSGHRHERASGSRHVSASHVASVPPSTVSRSLSVRERAALDLLLSVDFPGVEALREQALTVTADDGQGMVLGLVVEEGQPVAQVIGRTPVQAVVDGDGYDGGLLLFVDDGRLSALEYWWVTEEMPTVFPPLTAVGSPVFASK